VELAPQDVLESSRLLAGAPIQEIWYSCPRFRPQPDLHVAVALGRWL